MTTYKYKGISAGGTEVEGVVEAANKQDAVKRAKANCRVLVSVEPMGSGKLDNIMNADIGAMLSGGKVKPKALSVLCSQLAIELKAGLPLVSSLELVADNEPDKRLKQMLTEAAEQVHSGSGLADALEQCGSFLPRTFIETVRAGEESGNLDECFSRLQAYYENSANVGSKVGSALIYPSLLLVVAVAVVAIILIKAVPVFENSFANLGNELPAPTRILIAMSHFMTENVLLLVLIIAALVAVIVVFKRTDKGKHLFGKLALVFPGIGDVNRMNAATQLCSTLCTMLAAGLPLVRATQITADVVDNILIKEDIETSAGGMLEGKRLGEGLKKSPWLPPMLLEMVAVGEETGKMEDTLTVVNDYYTKEVGTAVERALGILEPVIVIFMAAIVVFILLSVYLPLFSMYGSV